jgi:uncharacterized protein
MTPPRVASLDFVRGACVLAMLPATLPWLCRPFHLFAVHPEPGGGWDRHILALLVLLVDHKILPLFAVLFGMGVALQFRGVDRGDPKPFVRRYLIRMGVLFLLGMIHTILFWWGDLLTVYAFVGFHVILFLVAGGIIESVTFYSCFLIFYGMLIVGTVLALNFVTPEGAPDLGVRPPQVAPEGPPISLFVGAGDPAVRAFQYIQPDNQVRIYQHGSFFAGMEHRLFLHFKELLHVLLITCWYMIGCALLGARLASAGLLEPAGRRLGGGMLLLGFLIGVPCQAAAVGLFYLQQPIWSYFVSQFGALPQSLLYLVILLRIADAGWFAALQSALRAVGRTALSNYWAQSVLACVVFHGYGFGQYGISLAAAMLFVPVVWAGELLFSPLWLRSFALGPAEWLWRSLADRRLLPLRRA